jgi:alpha-D-xyloside xylohydrolase
MLRLLPLLGVFIFSYAVGLARPGEPFLKTADGVIIYPADSFLTNIKAVRLQVIADNIIRVIACPTTEFAVYQSLVVIYKKDVRPSWNLLPQKDNTITVKTKQLTAVADLGTGVVVFYDVQGKKILAEKSAGPVFDKTVFEGERTYSINRNFETIPGDAWYGLGQHQDGLVNYKGNQVFLFQNNTEVAVPFLISSMNYGILWDNCSITKAGDIRPYKELASLKLYSKDGEEGWLTAVYRNDKHSQENILITKAESGIRYEYLNDSKRYLPESFKPGTGSVTWEGSLASSLNGVHKLRFTYAGYIKVWIDGEVVLDRWRQAWNPGSAIIDLPLRKDKKSAIKIQWEPDGGESYVSCKWKEPVDGNEENSFGFLSEAGQQLDYYFIYGNNMDEVIGGYRTLTGKATMLPLWAFGFWQSRERYKTQDEILGIVQEFRKRKIPLDNIVLDWSYWKQDLWGSQEFDSTRFSSPDSLISLLHTKYNTRFMISVWPKFYENIEAYKTFNSNGWLYKRNIADRQRDWIGQGYVSTFYDAFNEDAQKGFWKLLNDKLYKKGVDAWWMDASEPDILSNVSPQKRKEQMYPLAAGLTSEYVNAYPLVNAKGIYEGQRSTDPNKRVFILTRSGFSGMQRYAAATWSGDISSRWHDMQLQIAAGINFSMSGLPYWTMDIGGFAVERKFEKPDAEALDEWREMNARWYQFGAFVPIFRVHGQFPFREIYNVSPEGHPCYNSMLYYNKLRYRLLPYIYSLAGQAYHNDYTLMRGVVMDFPADTAVKDIADQYMFGPSLLVNPVYTYKARSRMVYLPKGQGWYDLYTGKYFEGGQTINAGAAYERLPVFVKEGSIIPVGPELQYTSEKKADTITLYIYQGKDAGFTLYEDEGVNYNYEKGLYANILIRYNEAARSVTIEERKGKFPGMLNKRVFNIVRVGKDRPVLFNPGQLPDATIIYSGKTITRAMK